MDEFKTSRCTPVVIVLICLLLPGKGSSNIAWKVPGCTDSCSDQVRCKVTVTHCHPKDTTYSKNIPNKVSDLTHTWKEANGMHRLTLKWKPPSDGSYNNLNGFSLAIWELGTGKAPRCYSVEPSNWKRAHNTPGVDVSFFLNCIAVDKATTFKVNVTSLPADLNNQKLLHYTVEPHAQTPRWKPEIVYYSANYSDLVISANDFPEEMALFYDFIIQCGGGHEYIPQYRKIKSEARTAEMPIHVMQGSRLHFYLRGTFKEADNCTVKVEPKDSKKLIINNTALDIGYFIYGLLEPWGPFWNPRLNGSQALYPSPEQQDEQGRPLTYLVMYNPLPKADFYHLVIYEQLPKPKGQKLILNQTYNVSSDGRKENTMTINHDKDLEFVVQGLSLEKIYVFSIDALDSEKELLVNVSRIENEELQIEGYNKTDAIKPVPAPTTDNRMKIVIGLIITALLLLLVTITWYCFTLRGSIRFRGASSMQINGGFWTPNNSQDLKILPIFCWESDHYQEAVRRHVNLVRQYAHATSSTFHGSRLEALKNTECCCWPSLISWLLTNNQKTTRKNFETEIKNSEVIIYLSPRLARVMSPESSSSQSMNVYDTECKQLLSALYDLHRRGLGKRPHLVTFDCFEKAELVCLDTLHYMLASSQAGNLRGQRFHHAVRFSPQLPNGERQDQEHVQIVSNHSTVVESNREETVGLMPPLALATLMSGSWKLQNMQELLARLRDLLDYPDPHHMPFSVADLPEGWRTTPEAQAIERYIQHIARLYVQPHQNSYGTHPTANFDRDGENSNAGPMCSCSLSPSSQNYGQQCNEYVYPNLQDQNTERESECIDTTVCSSCGKNKFTLSENLESEPHEESHIPANLTVCLPPVDKISNTVNSENTNPYHGCENIQGVLDYNGDSAESSDIDSHDNRIIKGKGNANSCRDLNPHSYSNSPNHLSYSKMAILPPFGIKEISKLDKHPIGFSQDIIPPDQCRSKSGFTLERMEQLNADSGWSEENLDTYN